MIRRDVGDAYWLISQNDHALLLKDLAEQFGGPGIQVASQPAITGIIMHDAGWPLHDDHPTLNDQHIPIDVFESRRTVALKVWTASAQRAAEVDPYAGLLVSLHSLSLSVFAASQSTEKGEKVNMSDPRTRFDMNKFQHGQIELQEKLRRPLGLRTDLPLHNGLVDDTDDPREQQLAFDFRLLQALDKISLAICCSEPPFPKIEPLLLKPGGKPIALNVTRPTPEELRVRPWCFDVAQIRVRVPYKHLPAQRYASEAELHKAYHAATTSTLEVTVKGAEEA